MIINISHTPHTYPEVEDFVIVDSSPGGGGGLSSAGSGGGGGGTSPEGSGGGSSVPEVRNSSKVTACITPENKKVWDIAAKSLEKYRVLEFLGLTYGTYTSTG